MEPSILKRTLILATLSIVPAVPLRAQFASDQVPQERIESLRQQVEYEMERSRVKVGLLRLRPIAGIRDLGYEKDIGGRESAEWRSTVAAGAKFIMPLGNKIFLRGNAIPQYTWYERTVERRTFGGDYAASLLTLFNRMSIVLGANEVRTTRPVSSEIDRTTFSNRRSAFADIDVALLRRVSLFVAGEKEWQRYGTDEEQATEIASRLGRDQDGVRFGLRYKIGAYFTAALAGETTHTRFIQTKESDNSGKGVLVNLQYNRPRAFGNIAIAHRDVEGRSGNTFRGHSGLAGSYFLSHELGGHAIVDISGRHRALTYAVYADNPYYTQTRNGAGFRLNIGRRAAIRGFGETGTDFYPNPVTVGTTLTKRVDDATTLGGAIAIRLYRNLAFRATASDTRYTSVIPSFNRSVFRLVTTLTVSGDLFE